MLLYKDNAFLGAEVTYKEKSYFVVKINEKTVYLSKDKNFLKSYEERPKGYTWKQWCQKFDVIMVNYANGIEIDKIEVARGNNFIVPRKKKGKRYLTKYEESDVKKMFAIFKKGRGGWSTPITTEKKGGIITNVIKFNNGVALVRKKNVYFFYDMELDEYTFFKYLGEKKELKWPRKEEVLKTQKAAS